MLKATLKSALLLSVVASVLFISVADAAELINRSVSITNARPGEVSDQLYSFEFTGAINVGSIAFEYCGNTASLEAVCVPPSGLNVGGASLVFQSGEVGFGVHPNTNSNRIVISRPAVVVTPGIAQYLFSNVINQSTVNDTAYVLSLIHI